MVEPSLLINRVLMVGRLSSGGAFLVDQWGVDGRTVIQWWSLPC